MTLEESPNTSSPLRRASPRSALDPGQGDGDGNAQRVLHVAIVGGGIVGHACALRLLRAGHAVTLLDDDAHGMAASWGNAGHIATEQVAPLASLAMLRSAPRRLFAFGGPLDLRQSWRLGGWIARYLAACAPARHRRGCDAMRELLAGALPAWREFAAELGAPELLRESGHIVCWGTLAAAKHGAQVWRGSDIGSAALGEVDAQTRERLTRLLATPPAGDIAFSRTAQIDDPQRLRERVRQRFLQCGGMVRPGTVASVVQAGEQARITLESGEALLADRALICAGARSTALMAASGLCVPLVAERGYHLQWIDHDWPQDLPPVVFEDRSVIATRFAGGLRLAGFVEYAPLDAPPDPRKWEALARHARELGLPVRGEPARWSGARPTLPDYLPAIGHSRAMPSLCYAFGHQHLGLTLAPVTALAVEALIDEKTPPVALAAFDLARF